MEGGREGNNPVEIHATLTNEDAHFGTGGSVVMTFGQERSSSSLWAERTCPFLGTTGRDEHVRLDWA